MGDVVGASRPSVWTRAAGRADTPPAPNPAVQRTPRRGTQQQMSNTAIPQLGDTRKGYVFTENGWRPAKPPKKKHKLLDVPRTVRSFGRILLLMAVGVALLSPTGAQSSTREGTGRLAQGVCDGVTGCHVRARADVNGDGSRDVIGIARRGAAGDAAGAVLVRVKVGPHLIASYRARTEWWYTPVWQGVARLGGGSPGREIVVGNTVGAHTQFYRALTWRHGDLVTLDAPGKDRMWMIDGAAGISAGWQRRPNDPVGKIYRRVATRFGDIDGPFKGKVTTFRWAHGRWNRHGTTTNDPLPDARAYSWGGFQVPGLERW